MSEQQGAEVAELGAAVVGQRNLEEGPWDRPSPLLQGTQAADPADPAGGTYWNPAIQAWTGRNTRVVASMKESMVLRSYDYDKSQGCPRSRMIHRLAER